MNYATVLVVTWQSSGQFSHKSPIDEPLVDICRRIKCSAVSHRPFPSEGRAAEIAVRLVEIVTGGELRILKTQCNRSI